jgi:hypothetical protein
MQPYWGADDCMLLSCSEGIKLFYFGYTGYFGSEFRRFPQTVHQSKLKNGAPIRPLRCIYEVKVQI